MESHPDFLVAQVYFLFGPSSGHQGNQLGISPSMVRKENDSRTEFLFLVMPILDLPLHKIQESGN